MCYTKLLQMWQQPCLTEQTEPGLQHQYTAEGSYAAVLHELVGVTVKSFSDPHETLFSEKNGHSHSQHSQHEGSCDKWGGSRFPEAAFGSIVDLYCRPVLYRASQATFDEQCWCSCTSDSCQFSECYYTGLVLIKDVFGFRADIIWVFTIALSYWTVDELLTTSSRENIDTDKLQDTV